MKEKGFQMGAYAERAVQEMLINDANETLPEGTPFEIRLVNITPEGKIYAWYTNDEMNHKEEVYFSPKVWIASGGYWILYKMISRKSKKEEEEDGPFSEASTG